jgi:hypothetical protein
MVCDAIIVVVLWLRLKLSIAESVCLILVRIILFAFHQFLIHVLNFEIIILLKVDLVDYLYLIVLFFTC